MWTLQNESAAWSAGSLSLQWNPSAPWLGICTSDSADRRMAVEFDAWKSVRPLAEPDLYVREADLIVGYQQPQGDELRVQLQWRGSQLGTDCHLMDLLVSAQTSRLDSDPTLRLRTELGTGEAFTWSVSRPSAQRLAAWHDDESDGTSAVLIRRAGSATYFEIVHPDDLHAARWQPIRDVDQGPALTVGLFTERLEKGVIRRARLRAGWVPRDQDERHLATAFDGLLQQALPLAT